jgi:hypothetical protein
VENGNWRTGEPDVGTVARLKHGRIYTCVVVEEFTSEPKCWFDGQFSYWPWRLSVTGNPVPWLPITTPEEARLRERVRELEYLILHQWIHAAYPNGGYKYMTSEQKRLYDSVVEKLKGVDVSKEPGAGGVGDE